MTGHTFQERYDEEGRSMDLLCIMCGAVLHLTRQEFHDLDVGDLFREQLAGLMSRKGVPPTCEEERVRQVMDS